jgi:bifunctional non-homologous end joining protein LigD
MLASLEDAPLCDPHLIYEPKYDGIRALVEVQPGTGAGGVVISSRLGNDKTAQFPELVRELDKFRRRLKVSIVLDGEIVALDESGEPAGFQRLQGRIHVAQPDFSQSHMTKVAFIAFDLLRDGDEDLRPFSLTVRRARLERVIGAAGGLGLQLSEFVAADGRSLYKKALAKGWEGLIAKAAESPYRSGRRSADWKKLKIIKRQELVIGGWTDPRDTRPFLGALLLGVYDRGVLLYAGHTGTGFNARELERVHRILSTLETTSCPFAEQPRTNERPHWVVPKLVAEIKFTEWTADGKLRHPIYIGLRDDVNPESVHREPAPRLHHLSERDVCVTDAPKAAVRARLAGVPTDSSEMAGLLDQLEQTEREGSERTLALPGGKELQVGHLNKVFWPSVRLTKGDLMRYYVRMAPFILPAVRDRPLVMKRFPNGVKAKAFYQQRAPEEVPSGVRVEVLPGDVEVPSRLVGGSLTTLLYMTQLAAISQDPWFSRVQSPETADHVALDLDPMPGVRFSQVLDVARWLRDELERFGIANIPKTSGATGLHVYLPLLAGTSYESGRLLCQILATMVADKHPKAATVTRAVNDRGRRVYIDYLQNIRGKTLATAYSARASDFAGASAPVSWREVEAGFDPRDFTILTLPGRMRHLGDLWANFRQAPGADLETVLNNIERRGGHSRQGASG